jgi:hypothetical protein
MPDTLAATSIPQNASDVHLVASSLVGPRGCPRGGLALVLLTPGARLGLLEPRSSYCLDLRKPGHAAPSVTGRRTGIRAPAAGVQPRRRD